jgi:hypothetical protein
MYGLEAAEAIAFGERVCLVMCIAVHSTVHNTIAVSHRAWQTALSDRGTAVGVGHQGCAVLCCIVPC